MHSWQEQTWKKCLSLSLSPCDVTDQLTLLQSTSSNTLLLNTYYNDVCKCTATYLKHFQMFSFYLSTVKFDYYIVKKGKCLPLIPFSFAKNFFIQNLTSFISKCNVFLLFVVIKCNDSYILIQHIKILKLGIS